jgi:hypothetical protein
MTTPTALGLTRVDGHPPSGEKPPEKISTMEPMAKKKPHGLTTEDRAEVSQLRKDLRQAR